MTVAEMAVAFLGGHDAYRHAPAPMPHVWS